MDSGVHLWRQRGLKSNAYLASYLMIIPTVYLDLLLQYDPILKYKLFLIARTPQIHSVFMGHTSRSQEATLR